MRVSRREEGEGKGGGEAEDGRVERGGGGLGKEWGGWVQDGDLMRGKWEVRGEGGLKGGGELAGKGCWWLEKERGWNSTTPPFLLLLLIRVEGGGL